MRNINTLAGRLAIIRADQKRLKDEENKLREEVIQEATEYYKSRTHLLPTTTIEVPKTFWYTTSMTREEFAQSRFPTWNVESVSEDLAGFYTIFVLRKKPEFMPFDAQGDDYKISKVAVEPTPEIDQETLQQEHPDLYSKLFLEVVHRELDEGALQKLIEDDPETLSILKRHQYSPRAAQQRISASEVK